jgi:hypothetical protein
LLPGVGALEEAFGGNYGRAAVLGAVDVVPLGRFAPSALKANMVREGVRFAKGDEAHHIVAEGVKAFEGARELLKDLKISLQDAANGAKLDEQFHRGVGSVVHSAEAAKAITERLVKSAKNGADAVRDELRKIGKEIEKAAKQCTPETGTRIC